MKNFLRIILCIFNFLNFILKIFYFSDKIFDFFDNSDIRYLSNNKYHSLERSCKISIFYFYCIQYLGLSHIYYLTKKIKKYYLQF